MPKRRPPKPPTKQAGAKFVPTDIQRYTVKLHALANTPQQIICQIITNPETGKPITIHTLYKHFNEELNRDRTKADMVVKAIGVVAKLLQENHFGAACFVLKTQAGWSERPRGLSISYEGNDAGGDGGGSENFLSRAVADGIIADIIAKAREAGRLREVPQLTLTASAPNGHA